MKRVFLLSVLFLIFPIMALAEFPARGYRCFVDWENGIKTSASELRGKASTEYFMGVSTTHGYQSGRAWFVGGGAAILKSLERNDYFVPLYAEGRLERTFGSSTPWMSLRIGGLCTDNFGGYMSFMFGLAFKIGGERKLNVGLGVTNIAYREKVYASDLGASGQWESHCLGKWKNSMTLFTFKVGVGF